MTDLEKLLAEATSGPWVYDSEDQGEWGVNYSIQVADDRLIDVAEMVGNEDDARLIALAPELASALVVAERALQIVDDAVKEGHDTVADILDHLLSSVEPARAALSAIAKLTGGVESDPK